MQLSALVSSFYTTLSNNFSDSAFLKQLREIGFLVEFESLLSSIGECLYVTSHESLGISV